MTTDIQSFNANQPLENLRTVAGLNDRSTFHLQPESQVAYSMVNEFGWPADLQQLFHTEATSIQSFEKGLIRRRPIDSRIKIFDSTDRDTDSWRVFVSATELEERFMLRRRAWRRRMEAKYKTLFWVLALILNSMLFALAIGLSSV